MNKKFLGFILKLILTFLASWIAFGLIDDNKFTWVLIVALVVTVIDFFIVDLLILRNAGNAVATIVDGIMACLLAYILTLFTPLYISWLGTLVFFIIIIIIELLLHKLIADDEAIY